VKLISQELGRVRRLFNKDEITPIGGSYLPEMLRLTKEKYSFASSPTMESSEKEGAKFKIGRQVIGQRVINIATLTIFNDGIEAEASTTTDAKDIVDDIWAWAVRTFGFRAPTTAPFDLYTNIAVVTFDPRFEKIISIFDDVASLLTGAAKDAYHRDIKFGLDGVRFAPDTGNAQIKFAIDRRADLPFSENRYFCTAPFTSDAHLTLLAAIEERAIGTLK